MIVKFSRHSKNRMRKYGLKDKDVRDVVMNADFLEESIKGRKNAWRRFGSDFLRVTYKVEREITTVITADVKDKLPERLVRNEDRL